MRESWVIDPGTHVTSIWSSSTGLASHPSLVALDGRGTIVGHGLEAVRLVGGRGRLDARRPFRDGEVVDEELARSYLRWLLTRAGHVLRRGAIVLPLPTSTPEPTAERWKRVANSVGVRPVIADRPTAVALGMSLSHETERAHLVIEVTTDFTEIAIVCRGVVVSERLIRGEPENWASLVDVIGAMLYHLDPDHELDIREEGLNLVASDPQSELLARILADGVGIPVLITDSDRHPVLLGAGQIVETMRRFASA